MEERTHRGEGRKTISETGGPQDREVWLEETSGEGDARKIAYPNGGIFVRSVLMDSLS